MLAGAKQEGTSDVSYSRNQPSVLEDDREPQRQSGARSGAQQTSNPKRIADFRRSQVCDSRPPRVSRIGGANPLASAAAAGLAFKQLRTPAGSFDGWRPYSTWLATTSCKCAVSTERPA